MSFQKFVYCTSGINDTGGKFATGIIYTCSKLVAKCHRYQRNHRGNFAAGVVGIGGKFATGDNDTASKSPPVSKTLEVNLQQFSTTHGK